MVNTEHALVFVAFKTGYTFAHRFLKLPMKGNTSPNTVDSIDHITPYSVQRTNFPL